MPLDGFTTITVDEDVITLLVDVINEYDCDSIADAVETAAIIALDRDEAELAQRLAARLQEQLSTVKSCLITVYRIAPATCWI